MTSKLLDLSASDLLLRFGAGHPTPGSGSAAALQGLISARLLHTVISLTTDPKHAPRYRDQLPRMKEIEAELELRIIPNLERLFQADSDHFDVAIALRIQREEALDSATRQHWAEQAQSALIPATEIPVEIAKDCLGLARFAVEVFDNGFQSALGDSGVALNGAISAVAGCISIVELNLQHFEANEWTASVRASRDALLDGLESLNEEARSRLASQVRLTERKTELSLELQEILSATRGRRSLPEAAIESVTVRLQRAIWSNRHWLWKAQVPETAFDVLDPEKVLRLFGLRVRHEPTLGQYVNRGTTVEVAGQIDQPARTVSISDQFSKRIQKFTSAHELGHYLFHAQPVLHRDRPLDGVRSHEPRDSEEWQADKFATYFLMPGKLVKRAFARHFLTEDFSITDETAFALNEKSSHALRERCGTIRSLSRLLADATFYNGVNFYSLAEQFGVSVETMAIRLEELELIRF